MAFKLNEIAAGNWNHYLEQRMVGWCSGEEEGKAEEKKAEEAILQAEKNAPTCPATSKFFRTLFVRAVFSPFISYKSFGYDIIRSDGCMKLQENIFIIIYTP